MYNSVRPIMNSGSVTGYFLQVAPITFLVGVIYVIARLAYLKRRKRTVSWGGETGKAVFVLYITGLFNLVLMPVDFWLDFFDGLFFGWWNEMRFPGFGGFCFVPSAVKWISGELTLGSWVKTMLIGNVLMFLPLGAFLPLVFKKSNVKNIGITAAVIPLVIELLQVCFGRNFDVDDLICNFIGILVGFLGVWSIKSAVAGKTSRENNENDQNALRL